MCSALSGTPKTLSTATLQTLLSVVDKATVCPGHSDQQFPTFYAACKKRKAFIKRWAHCCTLLRTLTVIPLLTWMGKDTQKQLSENPDRVDPSASTRRVQMCFIWNSQHVGGVVVPLWSLASTVNVLDDIPYFPACPKFSDKCWSKLYKTWAGRLANVSNSWDSTWMECRGPAKACEPNPSCSIQRSESGYFCPRFDEIGHRLWAALAPKIAEVRIRF